MRKALALLLILILSCPISAMAQVSAFSVQPLTGERVQVVGGVVFTGSANVTIPTTIFSLSDGATNSIFITSGGVLSIGTSGMGTNFPIATVITLNGNIVSITDNRANGPILSGFGSSSFGTVVDARTFGLLPDNLIYDAAWGNGVSVVTCPGNDCNFTSANVGNLIKGCPEQNTFGPNCAVSLPQGTITSINSAQSANISTTTTASCAVGGGITCALAWGPDDTTALTNFWNKVAAGPCLEGVLPGWIMITTTGQFNTSDANSCATVSSTTYQGPTLVGQGSGSSNASVIVPFFAPSAGTCPNNQIGKASCFFGAAGMNVQQVSILGLGDNCSANSFNGNIIDLNGGTLSANAYMSNVTLAGWCANATTGPLIGLKCESASTCYWTNVTVNAFGGIPCQNATNTQDIGLLMIGGACANGESSTACGFLNTGTPAPVDLYGTIIACTAGATGGFSSSNIINNQGATINIKDTNIGFVQIGAVTSLVGVRNQSGIVNLRDDIFQNTTSAGTPVYAIVPNAGGTRVAMENTQVLLGSSGASSRMLSDGGSTGNFLEQGGNTIAYGGTNNVATGTIIGPNVFSSKCTGTATANVTIFMPGFGDSTADTCTVTASTVGWKSNQARAGEMLSVTSSAGGVNASDGVVTVLKNGVSTGQTCTLGTGTSCNDQAGAHFWVTVPGDIITVSVATQVATTLANIVVQLWVPSEH